MGSNDSHDEGLPVNDIIAALTEQDLLVELERVERLIARSTTLSRWVDSAGRSQIRISHDLLALAEREHALVAELRLRRRTSSPAVPAAA